MLIHRPDTDNNAITLCRQPGLMSTSIVYTITCHRCNQIYDDYMNRPQSTPIWSQFIIDTMLELGYVLLDTKRFSKDIDMNPSSVYKWLRGEQIPTSRHTIDKLSRVTGKSVKEILDVIQGKDR